MCWLIFKFENKTFLTSKRFFSPTWLLVLASVVPLSSSSISTCSLILLVSNLLAKCLIQLLLIQIDAKHNTYTISKHIYEIITFYSFKMNVRLLLHRDNVLSHKIISYNFILLFWLFARVRFFPRLLLKSPNLYRYSQNQI